MARTKSIKKYPKIVLFNTKVYGLEKSIKASGNSMRTSIDSTDVNDKDLLRAKKLSNTPCGSGHDQFLTGIIVQFDITAPLYQWKEIQRYKFLDFISSTSTMHCLTNKSKDRQFDLDKQCNQFVWQETIDRLKVLIKKYNRLGNEDKKEQLWYEIISNLPCGFMLTASMTTNYRQLKTIYHQRKDHKLKEWRMFCEWIKSLPHSELIIGEEKE